MAKVRFLSGDEQPPVGERFLLIAARQRKGVKVVRHDSSAQRRSSFTYFVGPDRWEFWLAEGRLLADRLRLPAVYVRRELAADPSIHGTAVPAGCGLGSSRRAALANVPVHLNRVLTILKD